MQFSNSGELVALVPQLLTKKIKRLMHLPCPLMIHLLNLWRCSLPAATALKHCLQASKQLCQRQQSKEATFHNNPQVCQFLCSPKSPTRSQVKARLFTCNHKKMKTSLKIFENLFECKVFQWRVFGNTFLGIVASYYVECAMYDIRIFSLERSLNIIQLSFSLT